MAGALCSLAWALPDHHQGNVMMDVVSRLIGSGKSMDQVIVDGILPAMSEVGFLWERRRLDIFQEHLATETVRCVLAGVVWTSKTVAASPQRTALVSCVPGDKHDLVPLALWACLMVRGWAVRNLGTGFRLGVSSVANASTSEGRIEPGSILAVKRPQPEKHFLESVIYSEYNPKKSTFIRSCYV